MTVGQHGYSFSIHQTHGNDLYKQSYKVMVKDCSIWLFRAAKRGDKKVVGQLLRQENVDKNVWANERNTTSGFYTMDAESGQTPLLVLAQEGHKEVVELLLAEA